MSELLVFLGALFRWIIDSVLNAGVVPIGSLLVGSIGLGLAMRTYCRHIAMTEPWSMKKVGDNLWLLKRTRPRIASIHAIIGGDLNYLGHIDATEFEVKFFTASNEPGKLFRNGTDILIEIKTSGVGAVFNLYYVEHRKEKTPLYLGGYRPNVKVGQVKQFSHRVKCWSTSLY